jgi:uncharacterized protein YggE
MKKISILFLLSFTVIFCAGQISGNIGYLNRVTYPDAQISIEMPVSSDLLVSVKGMANIKADAYVAIFNVTQTGKTAEEVNSLIDNRINESLEQIKKRGNIETMVDMISFVPVYEYETEKKVFSKRTYNEVPAGFELKKNIHIKFIKPEDLNGIMAILSASEIYDLVRVDYFSNNMEAIRKELMAKARLAMQEKLKIYQSLIGIKPDSLERQITDGYKVVYPVEMYRSYQAYNSSSLTVKKGSAVNQADKATTLFYQPVADKEFDFVINPIVFEPVIQVMYELNIKVKREKEQQIKTEKEYILVTPAGELKTIRMQSSGN